MRKKPNNIIKPKDTMRSIHGLSYDTPPPPDEFKISFLKT